MDPATAILAASAASAAANYMTGQQNQEANQRLSKEQMARLNAIGLPDLNESEYMDPSIARQLDPSMLNYQQFQYGGDYDPTSAGFSREVDPTLVQNSAAGKFGQQAQIEALKRFQQNLSSGYDPEFAQKLSQADQQAQSTAQSRMASIMQDAARRGQTGSTASLAAQMHGSSDAMARAAMASQQAATSSYQNLLNQQIQSANMGRQLSQDEQNSAARNADIVNSFNQRSTRAYQQYLDQQAEQQNQAQLRNLNAKQSISNQNTQLGNQQTMDQYKASQAERAYQNQLMGQRQGVREQNFQNQMSKASGQNMMTGQQMSMNNQNAQAQASAIQGLGQGAAGYFVAQDASDQRQADRDFRTQQATQDRDFQREIMSKYAPQRPMGYDNNDNNTYG